MPLQYPKAGPNDVGSYQTTGSPWLTGSVVVSGLYHVNFPTVTNWIYVKNNSAAASTVRVGFTENGVRANPPSQSRYFELDQNESRELWLRAKDMYFSSSAGSPLLEVVAGLTVIEWDSYPLVTGSINGTGSVIFEGVG